jgi:hypothetical protein
MPASGALPGQQAPPPVTSTSLGAASFDGGLYLRSLPGRCLACGAHIETQHHTNWCGAPERLPELNTWPLPWAAAFYARAGIPVHPLRPGMKVPATGRGVDDATVDLEWIRSWWQENPGYNIGLRCGVAFDVLDVDPKDGRPGVESLGKLIQGGLTRGVWGKAITPSGGMHLLFAPSGNGNSSHGAGALGLDYRGKGGYIVGAPSHTVEIRKPDGEIDQYEGTYRWEAIELNRWGLRFDWEAAKRALGLSKPANAAATKTTHAAGLRDGGDTRAYLAAALQRELDELKAATKGDRNNRLNTAAFNLGQLVGGGELDEQAIANQLAEVARQIGLPDTEIFKTLRSGLSKGKGQPRRAPRLTILAPPVTDLRRLPT